jgi:PAS domain S-box-containing protein
MRGAQFLDLLHEEDKPGVLRYMESLHNGQIENAFVEKRIMTKDVRIAWSKMTCSIMTGAHGEALLLTLLENIDSQKRSEQALIESEVKFRAIYENSPMGIVITAAPGIIVDANPAFSTMVGYSDTELGNMHLLDLVHPADTLQAGNWLEKIYKHEVPHYAIEKRFERKDGSTFWAREVMSSMFHIGTTQLSVAIIENIETKKRTEEALEQKNTELTQTNQELEHFAYVASHDLQEPLRTITSFIQILDKRYRSSLDEDAGQFIGFIVDGAKRMQTLIHDLLDYSRVNRFNTQFEKVDLNDVFHGVSSALKEKIESNDALVMAEQLPIVSGNRLQLTQVFQNLIDNAIKFKAKRRKPEVIISVIDHPDVWELVFTDNGIGISQEYYQRIFVIFQRLHSLEEYSGTGIGLAICRKIIERHGGEIWLNSKPGKGTAFHLTLSKHLMM